MLSAGSGERQLCTWVLLIWLFEKNRANSKDRVSSQMMSSHFFLPRSSSTGLEQKSSCHTAARGTLLPDVSAGDHASASVNCRSLSSSP